MTWRLCLCGGISRCRASSIGSRTAPNALSSLFPRHFARQLPTRGIRHELQFRDFVQQGGHTDVYRRSCFGVATIWNMLPVDVAHAKTVKICQRRIQAACLILGRKQSEYGLATLSSQGRSPVAVTSVPVSVSVNVVL